MSEDRSVTDLVARAGNGDKRAWDDLIERYAPLVWSICRRHQLSDADAGDVQQNVWLQLVSQLDKIRNPAALPGWLATTTRRECGRVLRAARGPLAAGHVLDAEIILHEHAEMADQELLTAERHVALREALTRLAPLLPAADQHAHPGPARAVRPDQRRAERPGRQHRATPQPLPGQTAQRPGNRRPDQRRIRARWAIGAVPAPPALPGLTTHRIQEGKRQNRSYCATQPPRTAVSACSSYSAIT